MWECVSWLGPVVGSYDNEHDNELSDPIKASNFLSNWVSINFTKALIRALRLRNIKNILKV
jgi:hypothetical protein